MLLKGGLTKLERKMVEQSCLLGEGWRRTGKDRCGNCSCGEEGIGAIWEHSLSRQHMALLNGRS